MNPDTQAYSSSDLAQVKASEWDPYADYQAGPFPDAPPIPDHWENLPNLVLFDERNERGYDDLPVYSVTQDRGVVPQESLEYSVAEASKDRSRYKLIREGDLVYNKMRMWQGAVGRASVRGIVSPAYVVLEPRETADSRFFAYFYRSSAGLVQSNRLSYGIVDDQNSLRASDFLGGRSPVPPQQEQVTIADFLDAKTAQLDRLIDQKERLIELLEERRTALITKAVTKGLDPDVPTKDSGVEWLGEIPEHWEAQRLKTVADVKSSNVDKKKRDDETPVRLCNYTDVYYSDTISGREDLMEATASQSEHKEYRLQENDVIVTKDSETADDIAVPTFVERDLRNVVCGYHLALIRPLVVRVDGRYLYYCFCASNIAKQFHVAAKGVTRFGLSLPSLKGGWIPVPPLAEQKMIADQLDRESERTARLVDKIESAIQDLREYRSVLITAAVTGKIDVRDQAA